MLLKHWVQLLLKEHLSPSALWELLLSLVPSHLPALCAAGHGGGWCHMGGLREASQRLLFLWCYEIWCSWGFCCELHAWVAALGRGKTPLQKLVVKTSKALKREGHNKYNCHGVLPSQCWV